MMLLDMMIVSFNCTKFMNLGDLDAMLLHAVNGKISQLYTIAGDDPVSRVTRTTRALETSNSVCAVCISVAVVSAFNTLIHICKS